MFGNSIGNANQNTSPFGAPQSKPNTGFFSQAPTSPFGQNASTPFGQPQSTSPFPQNTGGQGLFPGQQQQPQQGAGIFGASNQNQGGGIFGQSNPQTGGQGIFGGQQQQPTNPGIFGNPQTQTSTVFGGGQQQGNPGIFGAPNQQTQQPGIFGGIQSNNPGGQSQGQGIFGATSNTQGAGIFGQPNANTAGTSPFGVAANTSNQSFLGNQGNAFQQQGTSGIFGGANQNQNQGQGVRLFGNAPQQQPSTSPFGAPTQGANNFGGNTQQQANTGGNPLFSTFANCAQNPPTNAFGAPQATNTVLRGQNQGQAFGQPQTQGFSQPQAGFGQAQSGFNPNTSISNKLGGTSWGVPTNPIGGTQPVVSVQPVRSKNPKLDAKHLVKCIAALDQFQSQSKEELRINFIQMGGQQPTLSQQPVAGFKPIGQTTAPTTIPSIPSFGGSQNLGTAGGNVLFVGNQAAQQPNLFNKPAGNTPALGAFGATQPQNPIFGGANQQQQTNPIFGGGNQQQFNPNPLFGGANQQQQPSGIFGANQQQQQPNSFLGGANQQQPSFVYGAQQPNSAFSAGQPGPMFQQNTQPQGLFGTNTQATPSLFGPPNAQQPQGGFFNSTPLQAPPSLFNTNQTQQTPSLFGPSQTPGTSLLGGLGQPPNFAQALGTAVAASTSGLGLNPYNPNAALTPNPYNLSQGFAANNFNQNTAFGQYPSLFNPPPPSLGLTPPTQQVQGDNNLVNLLAQFCKLLITQNQASGTSGNQAPDFLNRYVSDSNKQPFMYSSDPFSQLLKQEQNNSYTDRRRSERTPLYSEEEFQSYQQYFKDKMKQRPTTSNKLYEADQLMSSYRPKARKDDNIFSNQNLRIVSRKYTGTQQQAKKKNLLTKDQLPKVGDFQISPTLQEIKKMTTHQINHIKNFTISNKYGKIEFLEPVSLFKVDLTKGITISQDNVQITHPELEEKRLRITFKNFGKYTLLDEEGKKKLIKKMRQWIAKCRMIEISHDDQNGQLVVETEED